MTNTNSLAFVSIIRAARKPTEKRAVSGPVGSEGSNISRLLSSTLPKFRKITSRISPQKRLFPTTKTTSAET